MSLRQARDLHRLRKKQIAACAVALAAVIAAAETLKARAQRLGAIPGVGVVTAVTLLAEFPELGRSSDAAASARVGVAPFNAPAASQPGDATSPAGARRSAARATWPR